MSPAWQKICTCPRQRLVDPREQLQWEKDLIGLYVSDHPITSFMPLIQQKVTHYSADLAQVADREKVTVAGIITKMRRLNTKNGNQMAFATLEDLQGSMELVIFPKVWEKQGSLVQPDAVLFAEGKVDAATGDPKILVDHLRVIRPEDVTDEMRQKSRDQAESQTSDPVELPNTVVISESDDGVLFEEPPFSLEEMDWHLSPPVQSEPPAEPLFSKAENVISESAPVVGDSETPVQRSSWKTTLNSLNYQLLQQKFNVLQ